MILIGAGGHAKVICSIIEATGQIVEAIFDDNEQIDFLNTYKVFGAYKATMFQNSECIVAVGNNKIRQKLILDIKHPFGQLIHPSSIIDKYVKLGIGSVIFQGAIIQRDVEIGDHCIINTGSSIDHDCKIGNFVHISPGSILCGNVKVGTGTQIGAGAVILPNIKIGMWCTIGAGSVVTKDFPDYTTVIGIPGKKKNNNE